MDIQYQPPEDGKNPLETYCINVTQKARDGKLDPVIGRNEEIRRVMQILARRSKNNPVLLGDPGVGKTAIVEGLAIRIVTGDVPSTLKDKELLSLDIASLVAGSAYRGEFEDRLKKLLKAVSEANGRYILFMDELHTLVGAGAVGGSMDAANILKPALARGELHAIGATTVREYRQYIEKDAALERRFQPVYLNEPTQEDALAILRGIKEKYEIHHGIRITDDALIAAVSLSIRYIADRFLPDKAIDLVDEAASSLKIDTESMPIALDEINRKVTQLEIEKASLKREKNTERMKELEKELSYLKEKNQGLHAKWEAQKEIIGKLQKLRVQLDVLRADLEKAERETLLEKAAEIKYGKIPETEKTIKSLEAQWKIIPEEDKLLREEVTGDDIAHIVSRWTGIPVLKLLSSESAKLAHLEDAMKQRVVGQDAALHAVSSAIRRNRAGLSGGNRPIGSFLFLGPTGVGKTETAKALADQLFNDEKAIIRIDMSEYQESHTVARLIGAPPGYVGYEEGGQLTEAVRRHPYSVVLLDEVEKAHPSVFNVFLQVFDDGRLTDGRGRVVNFTNTIIIMTSNLKPEDVVKAFKPEFINRLDQMVIFNSLSKEQINEIVDIQLQSVRNLLLDQQIEISFSPALVKHISEIGYDPVYGARPLKRAIQDAILDELSLQLIEKKILPGAAIKVDFKDKKVQFVLPN